MANSHLSKSQFLRGVQCHKALWLYKRRRELLPPPDEAQQALFDRGTDVGLLAQQLFPSGVAIEFEGSSFSEKIQKTQDLIQAGVETIYEATFQYDDVLVMVDILHKGTRGWGIYEVKSSTTVKDVHVSDVAVQYYVVAGAGLEVESANLVHINNQYVRQGALDIPRLFTIADLTDPAIQSQQWVADELHAMRKSVAGECPAIDIGPHCSDPYGCDFTGHCWSHVPAPSVFNLYRLNGNRKFELYYKGIVRLEDIPEEFGLTATQDIQVRSALTGNEYIDTKGIQDFLQTLTWPLYFLDFETFNPAVPLFDGVRPYERIPFQYSLHYQETEGGELRHKEFLAEEGADPRKQLAMRLVEDVPRDVCVLVYNMGFEKGVLRDLARWFPEYAEHLMSTHDNMQDLIVPFRKCHWYKHEMNGSFSIKSVLPAIVPELNYQDLEIQDGGQASDIYSTLHLVRDEAERELIRKDLLAYCKMDTLGMVELLRALGKKCES